MQTKKKDAKFHENSLISVNMKDVRKDLTHIVGDLCYNDSIYVVNSYKRPVGAIIPFAYLEKLIELLKGDKNEEHA